MVGCSYTDHRHVLSIESMSPFGGDKSEMNREIRRYATFRGVTTPIGTWALLVAKAGFFRSPACSSNLVTCFSCGLEVDLLTVGKNCLMDVHRCLSPTCSFLQGHSDNQPVQNTGIDANNYYAFLVHDLLENPTTTLTSILGSGIPDNNVQFLSKTTMAHCGKLDDNDQKQHNVPTNILPPVTDNNFVPCSNELRQVTQPCFMTGSGLKPSNGFQQEVLAESRSSSCRSNNYHLWGASDDLATDSVLDGFSGEFVDSQMTLSDVHSFTNFRNKLASRESPTEQPRTPGLQPLAGGEAPMDERFQTSGEPSEQAQRVFARETLGQARSGIAGESSGQAQSTIVGETLGQTQSTIAGEAPVPSQSAFAGEISEQAQSTITRDFSGQAQSAIGGEALEPQSAAERQPQTTRESPLQHYGEKRSGVGLQPHSVGGSNASHSEDVCKTAAPSYCVTLSDLSILVTEPKFKDFSQLGRRLSTYTRWMGPRIAQMYDNLAEAGFYYTGSSDCCRCFYCGVQLKEWQPQDVPWVEHAHWSPSCPFVIINKGQEFISAVQALAASSDWDSSSPIQLCDVENAMKRNTTQIKFPDTMDHECSLECECMEYEDDQENFTEDVLERMEELQRENDHLQQTDCCKICMNGDVSVLFLPCRHLVTCAACAVAVSCCPLCREDIQGRVPVQR